MQVTTYTNPLRAATNESMMLEKYVELVKGENWHEPFVRWSFITYVSALLQRKVFLRLGTDYEYPTIYTMFVAPSAAKKTSAAKAPKELFYKYQQNRPVIAADMMTPAAWCLELKDAEDKQGKIDNQAPLYIMSKEFSTVLRDIGGGSPLDLLLSFYDSRAPGEVFRKRTVGGGVLDILNPAVTILGCTTPDGLYDSEIMKSGSTGFVSRFIIVAHPHHVDGSFNRPKINEQTCLEFAALLDEIADLRGEMHLTAEALSFAEYVFNDTNDRLRRGVKNKYYEEYYGRKLTQVYKLGMIFACLRKSKVVELADMKKGFDMLTETEKTFGYMFAPRVIQNDPNLAQKITQAIVSKGALTKPELIREINQTGIQPVGAYFEEVLASMKADNIAEQTAGDGEVFYGIKKEEP